MIHYQMMRSILLLDDLKDCTEGKKWKFLIDSEEYSLPMHHRFEVSIRARKSKEYEIRIYDLNSQCTRGFIVVSADEVGNGPCAGNFIGAVELLMKGIRRALYQ